LAIASSDAYSNAVSCRQSYRPLRATMARRIYLDLQQQRIAIGLSVRSGGYLADSQYITWLPLNP
jgi:hypothetical protein